MDINDFNVEIDKLNRNLQALEYVKAYFIRIGDWPVPVNVDFSYSTACDLPEICIHLAFKDLEDVTDLEKHKLLAWMTRTFDTSFTSLWCNDTFHRVGHIDCNVRDFKYFLSIYIAFMPIGKNCTVTEEVVTQKVKTLTCSVEEK